MTTRQPPSGFEQARGETQVAGDPRVYGVPPPLGPIPVGPAPPYIRQVISGYDARPIGGYDFVLIGQFNNYAEVARPFVRSPFGYITVVRRIEIEGSVVLPFQVEWNFVSNGVAAVSWVWNTGTILTNAEIDTFFVVPPNVDYGIQSESFLSLSGPGAAGVLARYIGNLILDTNEPPNEQVGSLPHAVHLLNKAAP